MIKTDNHPVRPQPISEPHTTTTNNDEENQEEIRDELVNSAVEFLTDPKVKMTSLNKKVEFLESKSMTTDEIQLALTKSIEKAKRKKTNINDKEPKSPSSTLQKVISKSTTSAVNVGSSGTKSSLPSFSWKDYLLTSTVFGAVGYGTYSLTQNFVVPLLNWPTEKDMELERKRMDTQFDQAFLAIESVKKETDTIFKKVDAHNKTIDTALSGVSRALETIKEQDETRTADVDHLWEEMELIKQMIPDIFHKNQECQESLIDDLHMEIRSLRSIITKRLSTDSNNTEPIQPNPITSSKPVSSDEKGMGSDASPLPFKLKVPSWQLAFKKPSTTDLPNNSSPPRTQSLHTTSASSPLHHHSHQSLDAAPIFHPPRTPQTQTPTTKPRPLSFAAPSPLFRPTPSPARSTVS